ncbi:hypothetical protein ACFQI7_28135 [Paenibacillus allorhizosphaerae]|uniref:Uncharacterized protein n=1 Tax=Paenibacillus allorhizosphaerae TaxID=2849866 RepID=A0ABN7TQK3_9BACL|nr:hypothetical protein [Paenibacillus allorhizosphaerae]CAG7651514.1 hypothetical protein PAECIP111802_04983 [Paenibacillus allorhizosphaerae]
MGVVVNFSDRRSKHQPAPGPTSEPAWSKYNDKSEVETFHEYVMSTEAWLNDGYWDTLYEGYPMLPPSLAPIKDAVWYVGGDHKHFGVWLLNQSNKPVTKVDGHFGWNPLVRKSVAPPFEPVNISDTAQRKRIAWIVDENGYGQYGMIMENGYVWVPAPRPQHWVDPIE